MEVTTNTAKICPVDKPESEPILVALDRLRRCPDEIRDKFWPPGVPRRLCRKTQTSASNRQMPSGGETADSGQSRDPVSTVESVTEDMTTAEGTDAVKNGQASAGPDPEMAIPTTGRDTVGESPTSPEPDGVLVDTHPLLTKGVEAVKTVISGDDQAVREQGQETAMDGEAPTHSDPAETPSAKNVGDMEGTSVCVATPGAAQDKKTGHTRGKKTQTAPEVPTKWAGRLRRPRPGYRRTATRQQGEI